MKILYGIQGTGHGHISRAREIVPKLKEMADVDILVSGYNCNMKLEAAKIEYKRGISLTYNSKGSVSYYKTLQNLKPTTFLRDIRELDLTPYDLVISDFEPVTAWASKTQGVLSIAMSHQASFLSTQSPRPQKKSALGESILKYFAPCSKHIGFHFQRYDSFILPPVIRHDVMELVPKQGDHITVYLPAFDHRFLIRMFRQIPDAEWHIFSPGCKEAFFIQNVKIHPVSNSTFLKSLENSYGVMAGAGFESCAEAMYLGKKLLAIPISNQYEQYCNEAALKKMGVRTMRKIDNRFFDAARDWIKNAPVVQLREIADTQVLAESLVSHSGSKSKEIFTGKDPLLLRNNTLSEAVNP